MQTAGQEDRTPGCCRLTRWCFDGLTATETMKEVEKTDSSMAALRQYWSDWTLSLTRADQMSAKSRPRGREDRTPGGCRSKRWCFDGLTAHGDGEGGQEAKQQQHGSSRSILSGLDPEFDSDC